MLERFSVQAIMFICNGDGLVYKHCERIRLKIYFIISIIVNKQLFRIYVSGVQQVIYKTKRKPEVITSDCIIHRNVLYTRIDGSIDNIACSRIKNVWFLIEILKSFILRLLGGGGLFPQLDNFTFVLYTPKLFFFVWADGVGRRFFYYFPDAAILR
jgi:hypothetical protein